MAVRLSARLSALAGLVTPGCRLADVGCDHGYLPIFLCQTGKTPSALAMDVNPGPLAGAEKNIADHGLSDRIEARLSDGLAGLGEDEADALVIAGMGGGLMCRILSYAQGSERSHEIYTDTDATDRPPPSYKKGCAGRESGGSPGLRAVDPQHFLPPEKTIPESVEELILQPQSDVALVRRWVREHGFVIADEDMVCEGGKFYPMMRAERSTGSGRGNPPSGQYFPEEEDALGPILLETCHPVLRQWMRRELAITQSAMDHMEENLAYQPSDGWKRSRYREAYKKKEMLEFALCRTENERGGFRG